MATRFIRKKDSRPFDGLQVTGEQNDTVGIVVWAGSNGHNLNQIYQQEMYLPQLPAVEAGDDPITLHPGYWVLIGGDELHVSDAERLERDFKEEN